MRRTNFALKSLGNGKRSPLHLEPYTELKTIQKYAPEAAIEGMMQKWWREDKGARIEVVGVDSLKRRLMHLQGTSASDYSFPYTYNFCSSYNGDTIFCTEEIASHNGEIKFKDNEIFRGRPCVLILFFSRKITSG